jgi:hypothetical protein
MTLTLLIPLLLLITTLCVVVSSRAMDTVGVALSGVFSIIFIAGRSLTFPDDEQYEIIFETVTDDFSEAPSKYGLAFKGLLLLTDLAGPQDGIRVAFILIFALLTLTLLLSDSKNKSAIFFCIASSMTVAMFVQMRQALALTFIVAALLFEGRNAKILMLTLALLSHISVGPFVAIYCANTLYKDGNVRLVRTLTLVLLVALAGAALLLLRSSSFLFGLHPEIEYLVSEQAVEEGNIGIGGAIVFAALAGVCMLRGDRQFRSQHLVYTVAGACIYIISAQLPLFQRLILPFYCYYIAQSFNQRRAGGTATLMLLGLLVAFSVYKSTTL